MSRDKTLPPRFETSGSLSAGCPVSTVIYFIPYGLVIYHSSEIVISVMLTMYLRVQDWCCRQ